MLDSFASSAEENILGAAMAVAVLFGRAAIQDKLDHQFDRLQGHINEAAATLSLATDPKTGQLIQENRAKVDGCLEKQVTCQKKAQEQAGMWTNHVGRIYDAVWTIPQSIVECQEETLQCLNGSSSSHECSSQEKS